MIHQWISKEEYLQRIKNVILNREYKGESMESFQMKYNEEYRIDYPETVGETDSEFDTANYVEWLEGYVGKLISDHKAVVETMQNKIEELSKEIINIIDYGECDDIGFTVEEIYNNALENIAKGIK